MSDANVMTSSEPRAGAAMSATIGNIAKALASVQGKLEGAKKDSLNPHFRSRYADLASVWDACREQLSAHGLAVVQTFDGTDEDGRMVLVSVLMHTSGEWISSRLAMPADKITPQGIVAASTYARRAALSALVGIAPVDDDGETAEGRGNSVPRGAQALADQFQGSVAPAGESLVAKRAKARKKAAASKKA